VTPIQTACLFVTGFAVSRMVLRAGVHEVFVDWLVGRSGARVSRVVLAVMVLSFGLSTVVPNALTVLALLPVISRLQGLSADPEPSGRTQTLLAMGLVYGANIGGVGSLLGSPANLYLLVNLELYDIAGRGRLHFLSWLTFGIPMALCLVLLAWGVIWATAPGAMRAHLSGQDHAPPPPHRLQRRARIWALAWATMWALLLGAGMLFGTTDAAGNTTTVPLARLPLPGRHLAVDLLDAVALGLSLGYTVLLMAWPQRTAEGTTRMLRVRDLVRELPVKGLLLAAGVLILLVGVARSGAVQWLQHAAPRLIPPSHNAFWAGLVLVLITILSTELLNNTTVATVMFPLTAVTAPRFGADPLTVMLGVSLASTCAFMTPVATPVNALAMASIKGVRLRQFLFTGLWVNLLAAVWITVWVTWIIPPILGWF